MSGPDLILPGGLPSEGQMRRMQAQQEAQQAEMQRMSAICTSTIVAGLLDPSVIELGGKDRDEHIEDVMKHAGHIMTVVLAQCGFSVQLRERPRAAEKSKTP